MPRIGGIDPSSDKPVKTYFAVNAQRLRLQLWAEPPRFDQYGRIIQAAKTRVAEFENGLYRTNREDEIEAIENSIAFKNGMVRDMDEVQAEARRRKAEELMQAVQTDPEIARMVADQLKPEGAKRRKGA